MIVKKVTHKNLHKVQELIDNVEDSNVFYKNNEYVTETIAKDGLSIIAYEDKKPVGCILVCAGNTIDTIVSTEAGVGSKMLEKLPEGSYTVFIHPKNERSIALFSKFNFLKRENRALNYGVRTRYVGNIKKRAVKE